MGKFSKFFIFSLLLHAGLVLLLYFCFSSNFLNFSFQNFSPSSLQVFQFGNEEAAISSSSSSSSPAPAIEKKFEKKKSEDPKKNETKNLVSISKTQTPKVLDSKEKTSSENREKNESTNSSSATAIGTASASSRSEQAGTKASGKTGSASGGNSNILALIRKKIERAKRYPEAAQTRAQEGVVGLSFKLKSNGNVEFVKVTRSSGFKILDEEALATVKRAAPYPAYESEIETSLRFKLED